MQLDGFLFQSFVYLGAAVVSVPIAKRLGLGSVLGYLLAGVLIGPFVFGLIGSREGEDVMHFAEFGVVMMLFLIGLELQPRVLWNMRVSILGMGGAQVAITGLLLAGVGLFFDLDWRSAVAIGFVLALSSTAIALQTLDERNMLNSEPGRAAFSVLLFQDIAVIPLLALLPLLAQSSAAGSGEGLQLNWTQTLQVLGVVGAIIIGGKFLIRPVFRFIAHTRLREIFTAAALLLIVGVALAMQAIGLSAALGAFLAGVVLADSEYRHELETDIEPFKGLLLGVFFIAVGAGIDFALLAQQPGLVLAIVAGLALIKLVVLLVLARLFGLRPCAGFSFAFILAQGGEFAFVLLAFAVENRVLQSELVDLLILAVALSMLLTPILLLLDRYLVQPRFSSSDSEREPDEIEPQDAAVIVAGYGRFGQVVSRLLNANGFDTTLLDHDDSQIELVRPFGYKVFYGDASRMDLLRAAGAERAKLLVVAVDDPDQVLKIVDRARKEFPHLQLVARARDRRHAYELLRREVPVVRRETFDAALSMGEAALELLGFRAFRAHRSALLFKHHDEASIRELYEVWGNDQDEYRARVRRRAEELSRLIQRDQQALHAVRDRAWVRVSAAPPTEAPDLAADEHNAAETAENRKPETD